MSNTNSGFAAMPTFDAGFATIGGGFPPPPPPAGAINMETNNNNNYHMYSSSGGNNNNDTSFGDTLLTSSTNNNSPNETNANDIAGLLAMRNGIINASNNNSNNNRRTNLQHVNFGLATASAPGKLNAAMHHHDFNTTTNTSATSAYGGKAKDEFRVVLTHHIVTWFFLFAFLIVGLVGFIGFVGGYLDTIPGCVCLGVGIFFHFLLSLIAGGKHIIFSKLRTSQHVSIKIFTFTFPFIGYYVYNCEHDVDTMSYKINSWITTSTDKNGRQHTHHHNALVVDDIGIGSYNSDDVKDLSAALGRTPGSGHGEPDESACFWCRCSCGCY